MNTNHYEARTNPVTFAQTDLRRLEDEARRLRAEFPRDRGVRLVVGLDLLIRRAAYRLIAGWHGLVRHTQASLHPPLRNRPR